ncbi:Probable inactive receptor kinase At4g23740 [Linum perenne]
MEIKCKFKFKFKILLISTAILYFTTLHTKAEPTEDKEALLEFKRRIHHSHSLNWEESSSVCTEWTGVTCNHDESRVVALRLPGMGIRGPVPPNTLSRLSGIQIMSLRSNAMTGDFPTGFYKLGNLTTLYLQSNRFTGSLPSDFSGWKHSLSVLDLSENGFNGSIPSSVSNLTHLASLNLANNSLSGEIPDISIPSLQSLNLTNNHLTGTVPRSLLLRYPTSSFSGNNLSTAIALPPAIPVEPPNSQPANSKNKKKLSESEVLGIAIGSCVAAFFAVAILMICCYSKKGKKDRLPTTSSSKKSKEEKKKKASVSKEKDHRLVFFEGCSLAFDLEDLLRASAEVLGKGTYGTTYKAALEDATTVAVKRLKEATVARKDFEHQMEVVGRIKHENVCALRAYYYSKDEKLMVSDFYDKGSLSVMLHGKRGEDKTPLDWETRMRVVIGAAKGIAYLHTQQSNKLVHGNVKASNIFLNTNGYGSISDVGLATLMSPVPAPIHKSSGAGYRAPEITDPRKATSASDVYSFGVLILELLTGKSPMQGGGGSNDHETVNLVRWVNSVVREEWTAEVFDLELLRYPNIEEEMVEMLQIGMNCVVRMPEQRPKMADVVKMVERIRRVSPGSLALSSEDAGVEIGTATPTPPGSDAGGTSSVIQ